MTGKFDVDRVLQNWLAEGPRQMPSPTLDAIVRRLEESEKRGPAWLPGRQTMNRMMLAVGGVAAVLLVVVMGAYLAGPGLNGPGIGGQPTPTTSPTRSPSAPPEPSPTRSPGPVQGASPTPSAMPAPTLPADGTFLLPGSYAFVSEGYGYTITIPAAGWDALVIPGDAQDPTGLYGVAQGDSSNPAGSFSAFSVWGDPAFVYTDPCHWSGTEASTGQTAADFATAVTAVEALSPTEPADATLSGYAGKHFQVSAPSDADFSQCDQGEFHSYQGRYYQGPGQVDDLWILDLDNGDRSLVAFSHMPGSSEQAVTTLQQIVDSIVIEPESP